MIVCVNCGQMNETAASRCLRCGASAFELPTYLGQSESPPAPPAVAPFPSAPPAAYHYHPPGGISGFVCPYCRTGLPPRFVSKVSAAGWIILVLLLFLCWPLFWVGFLIREERCLCRVCGGRLS
ncbi:MAG: hypothetical protein CFK52_00640 [Chloracidobacterium sp. CP2_5A]|nr:MAG: hypothetical protein CFK52_00640 [Chloracidobacterium sp. CP2_5A]